MIMNLISRSIRSYRFDYQFLISLINGLISTINLKYLKIKTSRTGHFNSKVHCVSRYPECYDTCSRYCLIPHLL